MKTTITAFLLLCSTLIASTDVGELRKSIEFMQSSERGLNHKVEKTKKECLEYSKYLKQEAIPFIVSLEELKEQRSPLHYYDQLLHYALGADVALDNLNEHLSTLDEDYFTDDRSYAFVMKFYAYNSALHRLTDDFIGMHYELLKESEIRMEYSKKLSPIPEMLKKLDTLNARYSKHLIATPNESNQAQVAAP